MVLKGQYLERATVIPVGELALEGLYHRGKQKPPALLVAPLPQIATGGSPMELPMVAELAWALHRTGHATLRFNPRGLGASQGELGGHATHVEDSRAALSLLLETEQAAEAAILAVGEGALVGIELARAGGCLGLVLVAPPPEVASALVAPLPITRVLLAEGVAWPDGLATVERIENADALFLRGLPALGKAAAAFVGKLGAGPAAS